MAAFDPIIGYEAVKRKLERTADVLANPNAYEELGVRAPRALLLYGDPGVGKTLMARCLIEASGRKSVVCRKDEPNGEFVKVIKKRFKKAAEKAPSVLLLDDVDKFANEDKGHRDAEEYVTVQSCIDELAQSGAEVFVLATANDIDDLPISLLRPGRLGNKIGVKRPTGSDAEAILSHYLSGKNTVDDIDPRFLARAMGGHSCAELEEVVNEAGLLAGYDRSKTITREHFMRAMMQTVFEVPEQASRGTDAGEGARRRRELVAYHEAGHVVAAEALGPGSATLATIYVGEDGRTRGFTLSRSPGNANDVAERQRAAIVSLGSRAAIEQRFGFVDGGIEKDLSSAFAAARHMVERTCVRGFDLHSGRYEISEGALERIERATAAEVDRLYGRAKEIICANRGLLDAVAAALLEKGTVTMADIAEMEEAFAPTPAVI